MPSPPDTEDFDPEALRTLQADLPPAVFHLLRSDFLHEAQQQVALLSAAARRGDLSAPESRSGLLKAAHDLHTNARAFGCIAVSDLSAKVEFFLRGRGEGEGVARDAALTLPEKLNQSEQWLFQAQGGLDRSC